jgi:hypothetical protein
MYSLQLFDHQCPDPPSNEISGLERQKFDIILECGYAPHKIFVFSDCSFFISIPRADNLTLFFCLFIKDETYFFSNAKRACVNQIQMSPSLPFTNVTAVERRVSPEPATSAQSCWPLARLGWTRDAALSARALRAAPPASAHADCPRTPVSGITYRATYPDLDAPKDPIEPACFMTQGANAWVRPIRPDLLVA